VSAEIDETGTDDPILGLGLRYGFGFGGGSLNLGLGYQTGDHTGSGDAIIGVSASVAMDMGLTATVNYSEGDRDEGGLNETHIGVGVSYAFDAFTVHANWGEFEEEASGDTDSGWGLAAAYDLGGGASLHVGYGDTDCGSAFNPGICDDGSTWSFGMAMSF